MAYYVAKYAAKQLGNLHFGGVFEGCEIAKNEKHFELMRPDTQATAKCGREVALSADMPRDFYRMTSARWHR